MGQSLGELSEMRGKAGGGVISWSEPVDIHCVSPISGRSASVEVGLPWNPGLAGRLAERWAA